MTLQSSTISLESCCCRYYIIKLVIPVIACVLLAFTAYGLEVEQLGARLAVVVPAAVALTALQLLVVATDVPTITYICPTTVIILLAYVFQLLIAGESMGAYLLL